MFKKYWDYTVRPGEEKVIVGFFDADHQAVIIRITGDEDPRNLPIPRAEVTLGGTVLAPATVAEVTPPSTTPALVDLEAHRDASPAGLAMTVDSGALSDMLSGAGRAVLWRIPDARPSAGDLTITVPGKYRSTARQLLVLGLGEEVAEYVEGARPGPDGLSEEATGPERQP